MQGRPRLPGGLGAVTCHGAVPSCPRRRSWGPGRPCPARGAAEVRPLGPHTVVSRGIASTRVQLGDSSSGPGGGVGPGGQLLCSQQESAFLQTSTRLGTIEGNLQ